MSNDANHNRPKMETRFGASPVSGIAPEANKLGFSDAAVQRVRHIYVHIPFCARICPYCAFYKDLLDASQTSRFCDAILHELVGDDRPSRLLPSTIYFGGGTPTALNLAQLELLLSGFSEGLDLSQLVEWTIEANPGSVSTRKAILMKKFGINRISVGVQSWNDELLKVLGREHNAQQATESFRILRDAGFPNINMH